MDASLISLDAAARDGAIDVVRSFLAKTGNRERSKLGTALLSAAFHGRTDIAKLLIEEGADVSYSDAEGSQCPLCLAAFGGHVEICKILVEAGAWMDWQKPDGGTALISAAFKGNVDVAEVLLQAGAFVNLATNEKRTPLHFACYDGAVELVGLLLRYGADVNVIEIQNGFSPIHTACYRGFPRAVQLLLEYGADACLKTSKGSTCIALAEKAKNQACVETVKDWKMQHAIQMDMVKPVHPIYYVPVCQLRAAFENTEIPKLLKMFQDRRSALEANAALQAELGVSKKKQADLQAKVQELETRVEYLEGANREPKGSCKYREQCSRFFASLGIDPRFLCPDYDRCYCLRCYRGPDTLMRGEPSKPYGIPRGWVRFAVKVDSRLNDDELFDNYHVAFHGTSVRAVKSILESGQLLLSGDTTSDGFTIPHPKGHIRDGKCSLAPGHKEGCYVIASRHKDSCSCGCLSFEPTRLFFTSPTIKYCEHPAYAGQGEAFEGKKAKCVLQVRQKPMSYKILAETVGATRKSEMIDPVFDNREVEWCTQNRYPAIVVYGLMVKLQ
eukprot:m.8181 g.8181  ORF g.8181 m.8181 type:complete len:557 (+) comp20397_c0_seq3:122-1792(+)